MILVGQFDSPYTRRVAISLHVLELPFARDTRSVFGEAEAMRTINPVGRIPALVLDDGEAVIDSAAILDYLDERVGPERALLPPRGPARRAALRLIAIATGVLDKAGAIVYEQALRPPEKRHQPWLDRCGIQVSTGLAALEALAGSGWLVGDRMTQADITVACVVAYFSRAPALFPAGRYPRLERLAATCEAMPAFVATRPAIDEQMPVGL